MKKITVGLLCVCIVFSLSSCIQSKNPLTHQADGIYDSRLSGLRHLRDEDDPDLEHYLAIYQTSGGIVDAFAFSSYAKVENQAYRGHISKIGEDYYLNVQFVNNGEIDYKEYNPVYYTINQNRELVMRYFDEKFFEDAIKSGKLKGTIPTGVGPLFPTLTDSTENIAKFIKKHKKEDFLENETHTVKLLRKWATRPAESER